MVFMGSEVVVLVHENLNMKLKQEFDQEDDDVVERCFKNRYVRYNEILGRGAFKTVYKGFDEHEGVEVAWNQVILDDSMQSPQNLEKVYSEVRFLKTLKHDNIVKSYVTWVDEEKKTINMITELFTSGSLREFRMKHKGVDLKAIKNWARQILQGLVYLHTHEPPIIHRDLSCDNIFVNGSHGEVKIGDIGLGNLMLRPNVNGLIGTPEFMAPELFEEKYDELVDIYSFGMCILELITCEYPYSECKDQSQIYKKVTSGIKPLCLSKVRDPQVKEFIEKCLVPVAQRLSAKELLNDPFLAEGSIKESVLEPLEVNLIHLPKPNPCPIDIHLSDNTMSFGSSCVKNNDGSPCVSSAELPCVNDKNDLHVKNEENFVTINLRVVDISGHGHRIEFLFNLDVDNPHAIAKDMIEEVDIVHEDVATLADRIKDQILKLVPTWKPSFGKSSSSEETSSPEASVVQNDQQVACFSPKVLNDQHTCKGLDNSLLRYTPDGMESSGVSSNGCSIKNTSYDSLDDDCKALKEELDAIQAELQKYREAAKMR